MSKKFKNLRYDSEVWRKDAVKHISRKLKDYSSSYGLRKPLIKEEGKSRKWEPFKFRSIFENFKSNMSKKYNLGFKVGWTAPDAPADTPARRAQYRWRRKYFKTHGDVI